MAELFERYFFKSALIFLGKTLGKLSPFNYSSENTLCAKT